MEKIDEEKVHFKVIRFLIEAGTKLQVTSVPLATAACIYHRFFHQCKLSNYDPYMIAITSLYLAGKVEEEHVRLRDVINVCYRTLHRHEAPLEISSTYWTLRENVVQCELLVIRMLQFHVSFKHPHKFILHYLKSLMLWLHPRVAARIPLAKTAWAILRDSYHGNICLRHKPQHIAVAVLYFALESHGVEVPLSNESEAPWWKALCEDIKIEKIKQIISDIINVYDMENNSH